MFELVGKEPGTLLCVLHEMRLPEPRSD